MHQLASPSGNRLAYSIVIPVLGIPFALTTDFSKNLRLLCNQYPSVAEVCRSLGINRQQFNKYLSGQVRPSRHNQELICEFFRVDKADIASKHGEFSGKLLRVKRSEPQPPAQISVLESALDSLPNNVAQLERYQGFYYSYFHALGFPGSVMRSLIRISRQGDRFVSKGIEHLWDKSEAQPIRSRFKYEGIVVYLSERIFIVEYETSLKSAICQTILYPSYRNPIALLSGITMGVSSLHTHIPKCSRTVFEYLGSEINIRDGLTNCGLINVESALISNDIRERIRNDIAPGEHTFTALHY